MSMHASITNASGTRGARITRKRCVRRGRGTDVFQMKGRDVFSHLAATWRCLKYGDVFYGIDGTLVCERKLDISLVAVV